MQPTLFNIPREVAGVPVFGVGWLLGLWLLLGAIALVRAAIAGHLTAELRAWLPVLLVGGGAIVYVLPALVEQGGLPIRGYGVMLVVAVAAGVALSMWRARQFGIDPEIILSLAFWLFISGIVGARLFYVIEYWERSFHKPTLRETLLAIINVPQGGLVVYGSLIAGGAALVAFVYRHGLPGLAISDVIAPGVVLGMGLGRIGCFLNGCCYGGMCEMPWAVTFPPGSPPFAAQAERGLVPLAGLWLRGPADAPPVIDAVEPHSPAAAAGLRGAERIAAVGISGLAADGRSRIERLVPVETAGAARELLLRTERPGEQVVVQIAGRDEPLRWTNAAPLARSRPVHPAQLYSAIDALLLVLLLLAYTPFRRRDGELTGIVLTLHPITRFLLEVIRIDETAVFNTGLSISQNVSLLILAGAVLFWVLLLRRPPGIFGATATQAA